MKQTIFNASLEESMNLVTDKYIQTAMEDINEKGYWRKIIGGLTTLFFMFLMYWLGVAVDTLHVRFYFLKVSVWMAILLGLGVLFFVIYIKDILKIMQIEKMIAYIFLTFILMVACFNIIGSLSMLIIDKKNDVETLRHLGADDRQIARIFLFEGRLISAFGAILGIGLGLLLCWLQQQYGLVSLGNTAGSFVVNAYPVSVHYDDVLLIFITVLAVGWLSVWYPVRVMSKNIERG